MCVVIAVAMVMLIIDFGPYGTIFMMCFAVTVAILMLLRGFGLHGKTVYEYAC
jgi:hypothetical protein